MDALQGYLIIFGIVILWKTVFESIRLAYIEAKTHNWIKTKTRNLINKLHMNLNNKQQGDVRLTKINKLPEGTKLLKPDKRGIVVAEGETTGHYHGIKHTKGIEFRSLNETFYVVNTTKKSVLLEHQEHNPVEVEPGITEFGPIHEMDHLANMVRKVVD